MKMQKSVIIVKKELENKYFKEKKYRKVRDDCHYTGKYIEVLRIAYVI